MCLGTKLWSTCLVDDWPWTLNVFSLSFYKMGTATLTWLDHYNSMRYYSLRTTNRCSVNSGWCGFRKGGCQGGNGMFSVSDSQATEGRLPSVGAGDDGRGERWTDSPSRGDFHATDYCDSTSHRVSATEGCYATVSTPAHGVLRGMRSESYCVRVS